MLKKIIVSEFDSVLIWVNDKPNQNNEQAFFNIGGTMPVDEKGLRAIAQACIEAADQLAGKAKSTAVKP